MRLNSLTYHTGLIGFDMVVTRRNEAEEQILTIAKAAKLLGVSISTLRNWDRCGKFRPKRHPINGYRLYKFNELRALKQRITENA